MTLENDLLHNINCSQRWTWSNFHNVKRNAATFGLDPASASKWKSPGEPALVYGLVDDSALRNITRTVQGHLSTGHGQPTAIVASIFIHQKPKVRFNGGSEAEIGDLLLVRQHFQTGNANSQGKAFLLQAKMAARPKTGILKGNELVQFSLYNGWTLPFSFPYKEVKGRRSWDFGSGAPSQLDETGVYAIGYKHEHLTNKRFVFPDNCAWAVGKVPHPSTTPQIDASSQSLASVFAEFVHGRYGRPWSATAGKSDHWSDFITQMLAVSSSWSAPLQRIGKTSIARRRPDILMLQQIMPALAMASHSEEIHRLRFDEHTPEKHVLYLRRKFEELQNWAAGSGSAPPEFSPPQKIGYRSGHRGMSILYVGKFGDRPLGQG